MELSRGELAVSKTLGSRAVPLQIKFTPYYASIYSVPTKQCSRAIASTLAPIQKW